MKKIISVLFSHREIKGARKAGEIINQFSLAEKVIFSVFLGLSALGALLLLNRVNNLLKTDIPRFGGSFTEGIVSSPRFINPVLAVGESDKDITSIVYSGLMKYSTNGKIVTDLAESYTISEDKLSYDFKIKPAAVFHDGSPVTSDDIIFTISKILDPEIKSPKRANWEGVILEKINDHEIKFTLKKPYAPFMENTTIGILPKNLWKNVSNENFPFSTYNIEPVGSGPYKFKTISKDTDGTILSYRFESFAKYVGGKPFIQYLDLNFYPNEETLLNEFREGNVDAVSLISPHNTKDSPIDSEIHKLPLSRVYGIFFNQNQSPALRAIEVRQALVAVTDRDQIINEALNGYASPLKAPVPVIDENLSGLKAYPDSISENDLNYAKNLLTKAGWKAGSDGVLIKETKKSKTSKEIETTRLEFSIATANIPDLKKTAESIKSQWEKIGAKVNIKIYESGDLLQNVIRPRKFDAILFGYDLGRDLDLYSFWNSSQRNDPGKNIAMYANTDSDKAIDDIRNSFDDKTRIEKIIKWVSIIKNDIPAIFLYSPDFIYETSNKIKGINLNLISKPSERWSGIEDWYIETDKIWKSLSVNEEKL